MQPFKFRSEAVVGLLRHEPGASFSEELPSFAVALGVDLREQSRGMDFKEPNKDGRVVVGMFEHSFDEITAFVDWSTSIWNTSMREAYRSRRLQTSEILTNQPLRDGSSSRESLLLLFEGWHESDDGEDGHYVSLERYPCKPMKEEPFATPGNLCAAFGLAVLDKFLVELAGSAKEVALADLSAAWNFASIARWLNHAEMEVHFHLVSERAKMVKAAHARHSKEPIQRVKESVRELWQRWAERPQSYPSAAAFSRAMLDKWPDDLSSEVVVQRWVREWKRVA